MDIRIEGNPGTGNHFTDIHIQHVETYAPNATTVINNHYGDKKPLRQPSDAAGKEVERLRCRSEIMQYVDNLRPFVASPWKNRYESIWQDIMDIPEVAAAIYDPGRQKDTVFNRNLVANIIYIMYSNDVLTEKNATSLTKALEGNKDHAVRAQLVKEPDDREMTAKVRALLQC